MERDPTIIVVLDACVLYSATIRGYLLYLADQKIYQPKWSKDINDEWVRNLLKNRPDLSKQRLSNTVNAMNTYFPDADVKINQDDINVLVLPDPDDRYVLATAIKSKAEKIITANLKDFPEVYINSFNVGIQHPDQFISYLLSTYPEQCLIAFQEQINALKRPPINQTQMLANFRENKLKETASLLEKMLNR
ncbi:MAG: PIN domain-containing protein [Bacteroidota bacterium]